MATFHPPLTDIPASLFDLAGRLRRDSFKGQVVVILDGTDGSFDVATFGDTDSMTAHSAIATAQHRLSSARVAQRP
jgi:hypothetical protein